MRDDLDDIDVEMWWRLFGLIWSIVGLTEFACHNLLVIAESEDDAERRKAAFNIAGAMMSSIYAVTIALWAHE